jgi:transposase
VNKTYVVGIDTSAAWLDVERMDEKGGVEQVRFDNDAKAHRKLTRWLTKGGRGARVVVEATGKYHMKVAQSLSAAKRIEVMVANPLAVKHFRQALLQRSSTDKTSATVLREFAQRMEFEPWTPPSETQMRLRSISRRLEALTAMRTEEKNRLHAARTGGESSEVLKDIRSSIDSLGKRIARLRNEALRVIREDAKLKEDYELMLTATGIGHISGTSVLGEIAPLSTEMTARHLVAYAGLDPRAKESGSSVKQPRRISKVGNVHLRRALYMPALAAIRFNPNVRAYAEHLRANGKAEMVIIVAVMRKLLHAIHGMLKHRTRFDPEKFYRMPHPEAA